MVRAFVKAASRVSAVEAGSAAGIRVCACVSCEQGLSGRALVPPPRAGCVDSGWGGWGCHGVRGKCCIIVHPRPPGALWYSRRSEVQQRQQHRDSASNKWRWRSRDRAAQSRSVQRTAFPDPNSFFATPGQDGVAERAAVTSTCFP